MDYFNRFIDVLDSLKRENVEDGHSVRLASAKTLYAMKKDAVRPVDKSDSFFLWNLLNKKDGE
jgi:hypothetical protein